MTDEINEELDKVEEKLTEMKDRVKALEEQLAIDEDDDEDLIVKATAPSKMGGTRYFEINEDLQVNVRYDDSKWMTFTVKGRDISKKYINTWNCTSIETVERNERR